MLSRRKSLYFEYSHVRDLIIVLRSVVFSKYGGLELITFEVHISKI